MEPLKLNQWSPFGGTGGVGGHPIGSKQPMHTVGWVFLTGQLQLASCEFPEQQLTQPWRASGKRQGQLLGVGLKRGMENEEMGNGRK